MQENPDPFIAMLGGEFISHGSQQEARVKVVDPKFPGLQGAGEAFTIKEEFAKELREGHTRSPRPGD